jgi:hypothetical protein
MELKSIPVKSVAELFTPGGRSSAETGHVLGKGDEMKRAKAKPESTNTAEVGIRSIEIRLRGRKGSPLVIHNFSEKAKGEIRDKQQKTAKKKKEARNPVEEFMAARYIDEQGRECAPMTALKKALVSAATAFDDLTKVALRQALFVDSVVSPGTPLIPIELYDGSPAVGVMREDPVTIGVNTRGLVYRPEYKQWQLRISIEFNPRLVSEEQVLALVDQAGWGVGICEGRPEKSSALGWGRFERA